MKPIFVAIILAAALLAVSQYSLNAQTPEQLYQKGLTKEEGEGALQDAINLYNQVADNSNASISLQAKALLHIGMCYEKLGMQEAVKAYQRLVKNFPAQKNEVAYARERLTKLISTAEKASEISLTPKFTKIKIPTKLSWSVRLSPDGKSLALVSEEKIYIMPLSGNIDPDIPGAPVEVNTDGIPVEYTDLSWSGDGKWIAFNDPGLSGPNQKIYVVPSKGGTPEKIIENFRDARIVNYRISLSPDGKNLAYSSVEDNEQHLYTVSVKGGNPIKLTDMQAREPAFSPDGKLIAYVEDKNLGVGQGGLGLWVVPVSGGTPYLVAEAGTASSPVWSPDGSMIAFLDYSQGQGENRYSNQINIVPASKDGITVGRVTSIDVPEGIEQVRMLAGWTPNNKIGALCMTKQEFAIYSLPAKGGQASIILNNCYALQPRWSRNGKQIIYTTPPLEGDNRFYRLFLASVPANGGNSTPLPTDQEGKIIRQLSFQGGNRVSPDGKWIISAAVTPSDASPEIEFPRTKIWKIAIDGSKSIQVTKTQGAYADLCPSWSPDGEKVAFVRVKLEVGMDPFGNEAGIYIINFSGGEPNLLTSLSGKYILSSVWSPDGKMIAYLTAERGSRSNPTMNVINVSTGESRVIGKVPAAHVNIELAWSPDSKRIAFNGKGIHVMNIEDGSIKDIETNLVDVGIWHLDWSPDGEQFVFSGMKGGKDEFWFLEDFLPLEKLQLENEKKELLIRKALANTDIEPLGSASPDGRYISFVDWNSGGNLGILNLETKERRLLTNFKDTNEQAYYSSWSPDGKQIAYFWWRYDKDQYNLSIVDVNRAESRVLFISDKNNWIELGNWSSDGKYIFATLSLRDEPKSQIIRVSATDGTIKVLKTCEESYTRGKPYVSPDNRFVACDLPDKDVSGNSDIFLLSLENGQENTLIKHPSHDYILGWTPDGKNILFASDRSGTVDAMSIAVENGKPVGNPKPVKQNIGPIVPMGFTQYGSFYYGQWPNADNIYSAEINFDEGKIHSKPTLLIQRFEGRNYSPDYSSDGKYLAYISGRGVLNKGVSGRVLCIRNLETGHETEIIPDPEISGRISDPQWSPDDRSIALTCYNKDGYSRIYSYDTQTKELTPLITGSEGQLSNIEYADPVWSKDGKSLFYLQSSRYSTTSCIMVRNISTGVDRELYKYSSNDFMDRLFNISLSPDGKWLAAINRGENRVLRAFPTEGGNSRDLYSFKLPGGWPFSQIWSRDGKYIVFPINEEEGGWSLMRIAFDGGEKQKIALNLIGISSPSLHPDGRTLAFRSAGYSLPENNIWEMKNFLPKEEIENK